MERKISKEKLEVIEKAMREAIADRSRFTFRIDMPSKIVTDARESRAKEADKPTAADGMAMQIVRANRMRMLSAESDQQTKRTLSKSRSQAPTVSARKFASPKALEGLKREIMDNMDGKLSCGVCGKRLAMGDIYYNVNLASYGCDTETKQVCAVCLETVKKEVLQCSYPSMR